MMRHVILFLSLFVFGSVYAEEAKHYLELKVPQSVENTSKIEVIEFFWYGCPHCYDLEPQLKEWVKKLPADVEFKRIPANFSETWALHAKVFYTAQALGVTDKVHQDLYETLHANPRGLNNENDIEAFFKQHGVDNQAFKAAWNSFAVDANMRKNSNVTERYSVMGVPTLIVNGKFVITGKTAGVQDNMLHIADKVIDQQRKK